MVSRRTHTVFIAAVGTRGDVVPCLRVADALADEHGCEVTVAVPTRYASVPASPRVHVSRMNLEPQAAFTPAVLSSGRNVTRSVPAFVRSFRSLQMEVASELSRLAPERIDLVLHTIPGGSAYHIAASHNSLSGVVFTQPILPANPGGYSAISPYSAPLSSAIRKSLSVAAKVLFDYPFRSRFNAWRETDLKLARVRGCTTWLGEYERDDMILDLYSSKIAPSESDAALRPILGCVPGSSEDPIPEKLVDFIATLRRPLAFVTFGSMVLPDHGGRLGMLCDILQGQGYAILAQASNVRAAAASDPTTYVEYAGELSYTALFQRVAIVVHHGGAGTTATALHAGVPQVVVPMMFDQYYWGHAVARLGLGAIVPRGWAARRSSIERALATAQSPACVARAGKMRGTIFDGQATRRAAERIMGWLS